MANENILSEDAKELLGASVGSKDGQIMAVSTLGGLRMSAGGREFDTEGPRAEARWKAALEELEDAGFVEPLSYERQVFQVTHRGYQFMDALKAETP